MLQSFDVRSETAETAGRIAALRGLFAQHGLTGYLIPHSDEHQNEDLPPSERRLAWATGFTGSAGLAIVLKASALLFVDGRYVLQAPAEIDPSVFQIVPSVETPAEKWLESNLTAEDKIGYDPRLFSEAFVRRLEKIAKKAGAAFVSVSSNLIDSVWTDRPAPPLGAVTAHPERLAGESAAAKLGRLSEALSKAGADALVLTDPASIAWTFNVRGSDTARTPLPLSYAIIRRDARPTLIIDGRKLSNSVRDSLAGTADIAEPATFEQELAGLSGRKVRLDPQAASAFVADALKRGGATIDEGSDPTTLLKAVKNAAEINGARAANVRDGAALVKFLVWFDREAPSGRLDEIAAVEALERFRVETGVMKDISFETISGFGPNGASPHYRVSRKTNRRIEAGSLFLIDSGAQYEDGTTDVTRTLAVGEPTADMRRMFTLVLKGHVAISRARFPKGTTGVQLDTLARMAMWTAGFDFDHGTGHGIGSYLSVHEGPQSLSKRGHAAIEPGMIISNEPGYYRAGAYGVRIENLILTRPLEPVEGGEREMMSFETLTLAPYDRRLIDVSLLSDDERAWIDAYHRRVRAEIATDDAAWLKAATAPL